MSYSKQTIDNVRDGADFRDFVPDLAGRGATRYAACPFCGATGRNKGLVVAKKYAKCFKCGESFSDVFKVVQHYDGVNFPESVKRVAESRGMTIEEEPREKKGSAQSSKPVGESFCVRQLRLSGLSPEDVKVKSSFYKNC